MRPKYDKYKDTGIEWLGVIPDNWELKRFKNFVKILSGIAPEQVSFVDEGFTYYKVDDLNYLQNGYDLHDSTWEIENPPFEYESQIILIPKRGAAIGTNKVAISQRESIFDTNLMGLRINKNRANIKYVAYLIKFRELIELADTSTIPQINNKHIYPIKTVLPLFKEQTAIANYLDEKTAQIDQLIENKKKQIDRLKEIRQIEINNAVTKGLIPDVKFKPSGIEWLGDVPEHWKVKRLKQIVSTKITDGPHTTPDFVDKGVPFISAQAINHNRINFDDKRGYITKELDEEYSQKVKPQRNDIFIVKSGATTGRIACVETDLDFNIWSPLALVRPNPQRIYYRYLFTQLQSHLFKTQIEIGWSFGTQENIGMGVIERLFVVLPTINEQIAIANYLDEKVAIIDQLVNNIEQQIEKLTEIRKIEIYNAVTGKIKVA